MINIVSATITKLNPFKRRQDVKESPLEIALNNADTVIILGETILQNQDKSPDFIKNVIGMVKDAKYELEKVGATSEETKPYIERCNGLIEQLSYNNYNSENQGKN